MKITRIEFDDPDDPLSSSHPDAPMILRFTPEAIVLTLPNGNQLTAEDQQAFGNALRMAYWQGKEIGKNVGGHKA